MASALRERAAAAGERHRRARARPRLRRPPGRALALPPGPARERSGGRSWAATPARRGASTSTPRACSEAATVRRLYSRAMSVRPIVTLGDPRLRLKGQPVDSFGKYLHELLDDLTETMRHAPGVGLAAPQLGEALQACVIEIEGQLHELVNPRIVRADGDDRDLEGCLSIPGYVAYVTRRERSGSSRRTASGGRSRSPAAASCRGRCSTSSTTSTASSTSTTSTPWTTSSRWRRRGPATTSRPRSPSPLLA